MTIEDLENTLGSLQGKHGNGWINITMQEHRLFAKLLREEIARIEATDKELDVTPKAFTEQACTISLCKNTVTIECDNWDEAYEVFEWLAAQPLDDVEADLTACDRAIERMGWPEINAFMAEPTQSPYEDAGGYLLRKIKTLFGIKPDRLETYREAAERLVAEARAQDGGSNKALAADPRHDARRDEMSEHKSVPDEFAGLLRAVGEADLTSPAYREAQQDLLAWVVAHCAPIAKGLNSLGEAQCPTTQTDQVQCGLTTLTGHPSFDKIRKQNESVRSAVAEYREWPFRSSDWLANRLMDILDDAGETQTDEQPELDEIIHGSMDMDFERKAALQEDEQPHTEGVCCGYGRNLPTDPRGSPRVGIPVTDRGARTPRRTQKSSPTRMG